MRVEEEKTFTTKDFLKEDFMRTEMYEETVETIKKRCRSPPVAYCIRLVQWLGSCFPSVPRKRTGSDDTLPLSQTTPNHMSSVMNAPLPEQITGIISVGSFHASHEGFYGHEVVVLTGSDQVSVLKRADLGILIKRERIERRLRDLVGEISYYRLLQCRGKHIEVPNPAHGDVDWQIQIGQSLPLEQCHPIVQAYTGNVLGI